MKRTTGLTVLAQYGREANRQTDRQSSFDSRARYQNSISHSIFYNAQIHFCSSTNNFHCTFVYNLHIKSLAMWRKGWSIKIASTKNTTLRAFVHRRPDSTLLVKLIESMHNCTYRSGVESDQLTANFGNSVFQYFA